MKQITVEVFKQIINTEGSNSSVDFINVCTPAEYKEKHIDGVRNVPLDEIEKRADEFKNKQTIYVHCRSGKRAERAITLLEQSGVGAELINVQGGILAWDEAGLPTNSLTNRIPIIRQVMIVAGSLVLIGIGLSWLVHPYFVGLSLFIGAGLVFAGISGWCGMAYVLAKMPWNK